MFALVVGPVQVAHDGADYVVAQGTEAGGHTGSVRAVYNGEADFASSFFSPPLKPEGEDAWKRGDEPDIPEDEIEHEIYVAVVPDAVACLEAPD